MTCSEVFERRLRRNSSIAVVVAAWCVVFAVGTRAFAQQAAPEQIDAVLQKLVQIDPSALAGRLKELKEQKGALAAESEKLKQQAAELEAQSQQLAAQVDAFRAGLTTLQALLEQPAASQQTAMVEAAPSAPEPTMAATPEPAMALTEATPAVAAKPTVNFEEHVKPILKARCMSCHNDDKRKGGLSLASFSSMMEGGGSGVVIAPGQVDSSRLFRLISRVEEPFMPPSGSPLDETQLNTIRDWIQQGAPASADSAVMVSEAAKPVVQEAYIAAAISDGPPPMPETALTPPIVPVRLQRVVARSVAASPRAPLVAVGGNKQVLLYNSDTFELLGALPFPEGDIFRLVFSVSGELLLAAGGEEGSSGIAVLWSVRKAERLGQYGEGFDTILAADISPDHRMIALGGGERKVRVYSTTDSTLLYQMDAHTDWILSVRFTPDGELLASADRGGGLYLWQAANGRPVEQLQGHTGPINDLCYTLDSTILASAGSDGTVQLWDTWQYTKVRQIGAHAGAVLSVDLSHDGQIVTAGTDGLTKRWDLQGNNIGAYEQLADWIYQARFASTGSVVLGGLWNGEIDVWKRDTGERLAKLTTAP